MRARTTAEAAEAILTKFLRVTRNPFGRAGVSLFIGSSPRKLAVADTYLAARLYGRSIRWIAFSFGIGASQANVLDESEKRDDPTAAYADRRVRPAVALVQKPIWARPRSVRSCSVARPWKATSKSMAAKSGAERPWRKACFCFGR